MSAAARGSVALAIVLLASGLLATTLCLPVAANSQQYADAPNSQDECVRMETQMWEMINRDRMAPAQAEKTRGRARPLAWDARLAAVARAHFAEMARSGLFSHEGSDASMPWNRVSAAGIVWLSTGENIAKTQGVAQAETLFMSEPRFQHNHRGNILDTNYTHVGVGIARGQDGSLYITQEFMQARQ